MTVQNSSPEFWLFGYGSLIWKPPPHFDRRIPGWVNGYVRRFWQARYITIETPENKHRPSLTPHHSQDHRGTPSSPGRVVTLIERTHWSTLADTHASAPDRVWGVAYRIIPDKVTQVKEYLDIREINGYTIHYAPFHPASGADPISALVYIGTPDNEQFVGPQDPQELAEHILRSAGPSGLNKDYLLELDVALSELAEESGDHHISDLARRVRELERRSKSQSKSQSVKPVAHEFKQEHSTEGTEEIENHDGQ